MQDRQYKSTYGHSIVYGFLASMHFEGRGPAEVRKVTSYYNGQYKRYKVSLVKEEHLLY